MKKHRVSPFSEFLLLKLCDTPFAFEFEHNNKILKLEIFYCTKTLINNGNQTVIKQTAFTKDSFSKLGETKARTFLSKLFIGIQQDNGTYRDVIKTDLSEEETKYLLDYAVANINQSQGI